MRHHARIRTPPRPLGSSTIRASVVAPMLNMEECLPRFLAATARLQSPPGGHEILLIDNGSSDRSCELAAQSPFVRVLHQPVRGAYAARNLGVEHARGEILAFIDPDCEPEPDWLVRFEERLRDRSVWIACGARLPGNWSYWVSLLAHYELTKDAEVIGGPDASRLYGYTNNMAIHRDAWDLAGPFDEIARGADTVFVRRVAERRGGGAVAYLPTARVRHSEFTSIGAYLHKTYLYGRTRRSNLNDASLTHSRPLSTRERVQIFEQVCRDHGYGPIRAGSLAMVLAAGWLAWQLGWWNGRNTQAMSVAAAHS